METYEPLRRAIANLLEPHGFQEISQLEDVDYEGSRQTQFGGAEGRVLVGWEADEQFAYVEVWQNEEWLPLTPRVTAIDDASIRAQIERLCQATAGCLKISQLTPSDRT